MKVIHLRSCDQSNTNFHLYDISCELHLSFVLYIFIRYWDNGIDFLHNRGCIKQIFAIIIIRLHAHMYDWTFSDLFSVQSKYGRGAPNMYYLTLWCLWQNKAYCELSLEHIYQSILFQVVNISMKYIVLSHFLCSWDRPIEGLVEVVGQVGANPRQITGLNLISHGQKEFRWDL